MARRLDAPPPIHSPFGRRPPGMGKLLLRIKDGPYRRDTSGRALWKFRLRLGKQSRVIAARDWTDAHNEASKVLAEWAIGEVLPSSTTPAPQSRTVNDLCDAFLASRGGPNSRTRASTVASYRHELKRLVRPLLGDRLVADVIPADVTEWQRQHPTGKSRTRQKRVILLSMLFRYAVELEWRVSSPVRKEHRVTVLKQGERRGKLRGDQRVGIALTPTQLDAIVAKLEYPNTLLVRLTAWTGLREAEVTHLRVIDVSTDADVLTVASDISCQCRECSRNDGERHTKSGKARIVPVPPELIPDLQAYVAERVERFGTDGWLFPRWYRPPKGRYPASAQRARRDVLAMFQDAAVAAKASPTPSGPLRFHDLRTTAHTWLTERSRGHLVAVSVALGHRLPGMAEVYNRLAADPVLLRAALFPEVSTPALAIVR